jgi:hypothetical protein
MEIKVSTQQMLKILYVLSWIIFLGVCIDAGSFIFNGVYTVTVNAYAAKYFGLSALYEFDSGHFLVQLLFMSIAGVMKALIFYLIVKILHEKKLNMSQPFNTHVQRFIVNVAYLSVGIGLFSHWGASYAEWLAKEGVQMPDAQQLHLDGAGVWIFMSVILFVIAQIFKRGIEIQTENELTI